MGVRIIRPGRKIYHIPGLGIETREALASVSANWWEVAGKTCVGAYQAKGAASLAASYVNLANPGTYDAAPGTAPSFDAATGWTFNGTTQFLLVAIAPTASWSILVQFSNMSAANYYGICGAIGNDDIVSMLWVNPKNESTKLAYYNMADRSAGGLVTGAGVDSGVIGVTGPDAYLDGIYKGSFAQPVNKLTAKIAIGGLYLTNYDAVWMRGCSIASLVIYSDTLIAAEVATVSAAMAAL